MSESEILKSKWEEFDEMCRIQLSEIPETEENVQENTHSYKKKIVFHICVLVLFTVCIYYIIGFDVIK